MNLEEVKQKFPESASEIETLESLGFATRSDVWIDSLDSARAQIACWLVGKIGDDRDADTLINLLSGQRHELWISAAEVRFWACLAVGAIEIKEALPQLQALAQTDRMTVAGW